MKLPFHFGNTERPGDEGTAPVDSRTQIFRDAGVVTSSLDQHFVPENPYPLVADDRRSAAELDKRSISTEELGEELRNANKRWFARELDRVPLDFSGEQQPGRVPMQQVAPSESRDLATARILQHAAIIGGALVRRHEATNAQKAQKTFAKKANWL